MNTQPRISIVTPSFNQGQFIEKTITSILDQNYPNLEYFIIDGGSTDNTVEIIKKYEKYIDYWVSEPDRGQSHAINKGLARSTGQIFNWINSDDYLEKNALFHVAEAWQEDKNAAAWVGATNRCGADGFLQYISYPNGLWLEHLSCTTPSNCVFQPSCFFNIKDIRELGGVVESLYYSMDLDLYIKLLSKKYFKKGKGIWSTAIAHPDAKTVKEIKENNIEKSEYYKSLKMEEASEAALNRSKRIYFYTMPSSLKKEINKLITQNKITNEIANVPFSFYKRNTIAIYCSEKKLTQDFLNFLANCFDKILHRFYNLHFIIIHPEAKKISNLIQIENVQCKTQLPRNLKQIKICIYFDKTPDKDIPIFLAHGIPIVTHPDNLKNFELEEGESCFQATNDYDLIFKSILLLIDCSVWGNISTQSIIKFYTKDNNAKEILLENKKEKILFCFSKNTHIHTLSPLYDSLIEELEKTNRKDIEIGFFYSNLSPQEKIILDKKNLQQIQPFKFSVITKPQDFKPDLTFITDSTCPFLENYGKLIHIGYSVLSEEQYGIFSKNSPKADLVCVSGKQHQKDLRSTFSNSVVATGICKLDELFSGKISRKKILQLYNLPDQKYILFAPTFNNELSAIPFVKDKIGEILPNNDTILIIKLHPNSNPEYKKMYSQLPTQNSQIIYTDELDITPFLALCDVMISDVSSDMMEFAALDKPVILFNNPNREKYQNYNPQNIEFKWRDIGLQVNNLKEMKEAVADCLNNPQKFSEKRQKYSDLLFANKKQGNAAERIVKLSLSLLKNEK